MRLAGGARLALPAGRGAAGYQLAHRLAGRHSQSTALAAELRGRGFRFVGPTTAYATMQAAGLVNDHADGCCVRDEVDREQRAAAARLT